eukprot:SAG11_NODE_18848_length_480_cov_0.611549_2_plen_48_part_01
MLLISVTVPKDTTLGARSGQEGAPPFWRCCWVRGTATSLLDSCQTGVD